MRQLHRDCALELGRLCRVDPVEVKMMKLVPTWIYLHREDTRGKGVALAGGNS